MKLYISLIAILTFTVGFGQIDIKKSSISTAGGSQTAGNTTLTYAIGEVAVQENTQGNTHISEGFIGPDIIRALGIEDYAQLAGVNIYPNPVTDYIHIDLPQSQQYEFYLFDLNGKLINRYQSDEKTYTINIQNLQTAVYALVVIDKNHKRKTLIKIQKL